ncbi:MAG: ABC transporter ATP-binding protein [Rickettsiales bacterium]|nr:MAG: ABC transporter ATP-binding protein [Rickettsiales bacterium]
MAKGGKEKPKNFWSTLRRILSYISGMEYMFFVVVILCIIAPLCRITTTAFFQIGIDDYIMPLSKNNTPELFSAFIVFLGTLAKVFIIGTISIYAYKQIMVRISTKMLYKMRIDLFSKMESLPIKYFDTHKHGDIMSIYTNDVDNIREMLTNSISGFIFNIVMTISNLVMMIYFSWKMSIVIGIVIFLIFSAIKHITSKTGKLFKEQQEALGKLNGYVEEIIEGQKVIKVFNREQQIKNEFNDSNNKLREIAKTANNYGNMLMPVLVNISNIGYSIIVMLGSFLVFKGYMTLGIAIAFFQYARSFVFPISEISQGYNVVMNAMAGAERIFVLLDEKPEYDDGNVESVWVNPLGQPLANEEKGAKLAWKNGDIFTPLNGYITLKNVVFGYNDEKTILKGINVYAKPDQKIALVGSTGAGKTTITNLINRFYDITEGEILFDGINVKDIKKDCLRKSVSIVLQDTNLFTGSVLDNIRYGRLNATDEEVKKAAELANASTFINHLPNGYDTILTDNGGNLSQGEKQLLSIARAMLSKSKVLILDEATSSIDTRTEKLIEEGMDTLMKGRTVFVIAHRLSTIRNANLIVVMENGQILEKGDHDELYTNKGKYYQLSTGLIEME